MALSNTQNSHFIQIIKRHIATRDLYLAHTACWTILLPREVLWDTTPDLCCSESRRRNRVVPPFTSPARKYKVRQGHYDGKQYSTDCMCHNLHPLHSCPLVSPLLVVDQASWFFARLSCHPTLPWCLALTQCVKPEYWLVKKAMLSLFTIKGAPLNSVQDTV